MTISLRGVGVVVAVGVVAAVAWGLPYLSPTKGVERQWARVIKAVEKKDEGRLRAILAEDYVDDWGSNREEAVKLALGVFQHFVTLTITREQPTLVMESKSKATTGARVVVRGQGSPVAQMVVQGSEGMTAPTRFRWRRESWRPWDWRLTGLENEDIRANLPRFRRMMDQAGAAGVTLP